MRLSASICLFLNFQVFVYNGCCRLAFAPWCMLNTHFLELPIVLLFVCFMFYVFVQLRIFRTLAEPVVETGLHRYTSTTLCFVQLASQ